MTDPHEDGFDRDDELRLQLQSLDPAASLAPADPTRVARLLEGTMTEHETATRTPSRLTWLLATAAVVLIAAAGAFAVVGHDRGSDELPTAQDSTGEAADPTVTSLVADGAADGKCMVPSAEVLAEQGLAFEGTVTDITDGVATLEPSEFFAGKATDLVEVAAPSKDMQALIQAVDFQVGGSYLVAASDGQVLVCGFSGPSDPALEDLYAEAFPR
ncbi:MAG: hypothetical protein F2667_12115 [Actinobacteria bacterium]|uniref:Unannotated protein n=1 Tax=freshwater metagenome TaxID=449393 RepID=A0A6J6RUX9_9ZZZZ|nr:hypothetical protein [Actinomycetota bacterium]